jgi:hypothetical protein
VIRSTRISGLIIVLAATAVSRATAQSSVSDILIVDSLSPAKMQLRDYVAQLRDTLTVVESIHARIARANASGMNSVVLSSGRQLGKSCHASMTMVETTEQRVGMMKTSDVRGEQALASFRVSLATLADNLRLCQHEDSTVMAGASPDRKRIQQVATAARAAIMQYDQVRDALLTLLGINLPVNSYVPPPRH